jgi:hypothetical protein
MPASIFAGSKVKTLKSTLSLNGGADVISSTVDPTAVAVDASPGSLLLNTTTGKQYRKTDSGSSTNWTEVGSGTSGINYISNPSAATNTTGWATYADAAGTAPVDGTGGSPTVTWTRSTTTPLRGAADFNFITPGGGSVQGQGVSTDFSIDLADQAKVLTVTFDYEVVSGTYASGDLTCYLIADPTGTPVVIQPAGYVVQAATVGTKMRQIATFQTQATGQTYRLCFHVASTSTAAYVLAVDSVSVGPQVVQYGSPITDPVDYIPTYTGFGTVTQTNMGLRWWRSGANLHIQGDFTIGTVAAATASFSLPAGLTTNLAAVSGNFQIVGKATNNSIVTPQAKDYNLITTNGASTINFSICEIGNATNPLAPQTGSAIFPSGTVVSVNLVVQITGWSSTVQMSNDTDTRVVAAAIGLSANQTISTATFTKILLNSVVLDTHGAWDSGSSKYTVTVPGIYEFSSNVTWGTTATGYRTSILYKNGSRFLDLSSIDNPSATNSPTAAGKSPPIPALAGDFFELYVYQTSGGGLNVLGTAGTTLQTTNFGVRRLSGPSAIAASETVAARYTTNAGWTIANNSATIVNFVTPDFDTHGAVTVGASWKFTAPIAGKYRVNSVFQFPLGNYNSGAQFAISINKNGSTLPHSSSPVVVDDTAVSWYPGTSVATVIHLNAGDYIDARVFQNNGAPANLSTDAASNYISINRIGN